jgi:multidrug resistance efflux pump
MKNRLIKILVILVFIVLILIIFILIKSNFQVNSQTKQVKSLIESPTDGYVIYNVPYGKIVSKGELVAEIDPTVCQNEVKDDLADMKYLRIEYKRYRFLARVNAEAKEKFDIAEEAYADGLAKLHEDQASLKHCYQYAPFKGKITDITTSTGSGVSDGGTILEITKIG